METISVKNVLERGCRKLRYIGGTMSQAISRRKYVNACLERYINEIIEIHQRLFFDQRNFVNFNKLLKISHIESSKWFFRDSNPS